MATAEQVAEVYEAMARVVVPLVAVSSDASWTAVGTAFVAGTSGPNTALLLTAAHNLKYVRTLDEWVFRSNATTPPEFRPLLPSDITLKRTSVCALRPDLKPVAFAQLQAGFFQGDFDIALLVASTEQDKRPVFRDTLALNTTPVRVGTRLIAIGYPNMKASFDREPDYERADFRVNFSYRLQIREGEITGIHPKGTGIHRAPGFTVDIPFDSGVSGGPLVDFTAGYPCVRGIISGDLSEDPTDGARGSGGRAFAASVWPALPMRTPNLVVANKQGKQLLGAGSRLIDLIRVGVLHDAGNSDKHVEFTEDNEGLRVRWRD